MFEEADEEYLPIARAIYEEHKDDLHLSVDPSLVMFLKTDSRKKAFAYCKVVSGEYELLTDKKFFIVIVKKYFNRLKTDAEKKFVILHEMKHLFEDDNGRYRLLDHNLKEFHELLQNPSWNLELVKDENKSEEDTKDDSKISLDFDFHSKEASKKLHEIEKKEKKEKENKA